MKKLFSISFAILILLSGMHFTMATHICGGEIAAVKWSFNEGKATCGMETDQNSNPSGETLTSNCCRDLVSVYSVDNNYHPSSFQIDKIQAKTIQAQHYIPVSLFLYAFSSLNFFYTPHIGPPDKLLDSAVSLSNICVFRI